MVRTVRQISSGGIVFRFQNGRPMVTLVSRLGGRVWCLPKGLVEKNETPEETAVRETKEETGLDGRLLEKIGEIQYWYYAREDRARIFKTVHFYLLQFQGGNEEFHDSEVDQVRWYPVEEASQKLTYKNERDIMGKAIPLITEKYAIPEKQTSPRLQSTPNHKVSQQSHREH
ncbi:MAG: NUDIX hydrolase [Candidatus Bathyarchaeia archaeon]